MPRARRSPARERGSPEGAAAGRLIARAQRQVPVDITALAESLGLAVWESPFPQSPANCSATRATADLRATASW